MTPEELFNKLYEQYNAGFWHMTEHKGCAGPGHCPECPKGQLVEGYADAADDFTTYCGKLIKKGQTIRFTHASNMGCLDGTLTLGQKSGYDFRLAPELWEHLTNCRLTR